MDTKRAFQAETVLDRTGIKYRILQLPASTIFFCEDIDGQTFDILIGRNSIKVWTFIASNMSDEQAGMQVVFRGQKSPNLTIEIAVTDDDDRDLVFSIEQTVMDTECLEYMLEKQTKGFLYMTRNLKARLGNRNI